VIVRIKRVKKLGASSLESRIPDPALIAALKDEDPDVRLIAAAELGDLALPDKSADHLVVSPELKKTVPALLEALRDRSAAVRWEAALSALRIDPDAIGPFFASAEGKDPKVRVEIIRAMGKFRATFRRTRSLVTMVCGALQDPSPVVREHAAHALASIWRDETNVRLAIRALLAALSDEETGVRVAAAKSLASMADDEDNRPAKEIMIPALVAALKDSNREVACYAAEALGGFGPQAKSAVPELLEALKRRDGRLREAAGKALKLVDPRKADQAGIR
jgi:HEAT repeat protein